MNQNLVQLNLYQLLYRTKVMRMDLLAHYLRLGLIVSNLHDVYHSLYYVNDSILIKHYIMYDHWGNALQKCIGRRPLGPQEEYPKGLI